MNQIMEYIFERIHNEQPLVHNITNYVTVNDCANALLAIQASPIMADDAKEVEAIVGISKALVLNMGTLNERTVDSMLLAGKRANQNGIPVVLDPVGAGASSYRNEVSKKLLQSIEFTAIRGNLSEIGFLYGLNVSTKGVDVSKEDQKIDADHVASSLAKRMNTTVIITGAMDVIADKDSLYHVMNGHPMMARVTGTGCMSSAILGAFVAVSEEPVIGALISTITMGCAGEMAYERAGDLGTGSFRVAMMDSLSQLSASVIAERGRYERMR